MTSLLSCAAKANATASFRLFDKETATVAPGSRSHNPPRDREVILFNNAGLSGSSREVPTTFEQMGANAIAFIRALRLNKVDVLGFSIGGMVAQEITLQAPNFAQLQRGR